MKKNYFLFYIASLFLISCNNNTTLPLPTLTTSEPNNISYNTATSGGNITSNGGSEIVTFGICWDVSPNPTIKGSKIVYTYTTGTESFTGILTGLIQNTNYYVRAYATNKNGTAYGNQQSFTTTRVVTDVEGNIYNTVKIGTQTWMVENLKTTKYNDGTSIPYITSNTAWNNTVNWPSPAYCWYNNDGFTYKNTYGALYNWYVVNTGKLAPVGWHIPTDVEWTILENYVSGNLGTSGYVSKGLAATTNWISSTSTGAIGNNLTTNNSSGFSALPGGYRYYNGTFYKIGYCCYWWSSPKTSTSYVSYKYLYYDYDHLDGVYRAESYGYSVRCIKD